MHLSLRILLLIFGILDPGICSESIASETLYTIFAKDNCTSYFIVCNPHVLLDINYLLSIIGYKDQAIGLCCFRDIIRWEPVAVTVDWDISYLIFFHIDVLLVTIFLGC